MTSRDFGFLTLRNMTAYQPNGARVAPNLILAVDNNGLAVFVSTISPCTINVCTINADDINVSTLSTISHVTSTISSCCIVASDFVSTNITYTNILSSNTVNSCCIVASNFVSTNITYTNILSSNTINTKSINTSTVSTTQINLRNNSNTITLTTDGQELLVQGFPVITEGNISSISSLYWEDDLGTGTLAGAIYNKNTGQTAAGYMVGIGTSSLLNGTLSVQYKGGDITGNSFHISSNNNTLFVQNDFQNVPGQNGISLQLRENQATSFGPSIHLTKTKGFSATDTNSELGYISFYGTNNLQNSVRGAYIIAKQNGVVSTLTPADLQFITNTSSSENVNMVITTLGNVGIGTTNPQYKLNINGTFQTLYNTELQPFASPSGSYIYIDTSSASAVRLGSYNYSTGSKPLCLQVASDGTPSGNVGIGNINPQYTLDVNGDIKATSIVDSTNSTGSANQVLTAGTGGQVVWQTEVNGGIPIGGIIMWSGTSVTLPSGWNLCDGGTYNGQQTPDLRGRFIMGAAYATGTTPYTGQTGGALPTDANGQTVPGNATGATGGEINHALTINEMPSHTHQTTACPSRSFDGIAGVNQWIANQETAIASTPAGGDLPHNNIPQYYTLAYIMRTQ